jgi:hypothetical protein
MATPHCRILQMLSSGASSPQPQPLSVSNCTRFWILHHYLVMTLAGVCSYALREVWVFHVCEERCASGDSWLNKEDAPTISLLEDIVLNHQFPSGLIKYPHPTVILIIEDLSFHERIFSSCEVKIWPPLWSSGQSSWLQIRRPGFDSRHYPKKN